MTRSRAGGSLAEILMASVLLGAGLLPLSGHWVKLTRDTRAVTGKAHAFQQVREALDRYRAQGLARLARSAGPDGVLPDLSSTDRQPAATSRMATALGVTQAAFSPTTSATGGKLPVRACLLAAAGLPKTAVGRLRVESRDDKTVFLESLVEGAGEPETPAWE